MRESSGAGGLILDVRPEGQGGEGPAVPEAEGWTEAHRWAGAAGGDEGCAPDGRKASEAGAGRWGADPVELHGQGSNMLSMERALKNQLQQQTSLGNNKQVE